MQRPTIKQIKQNEYEVIYPNYAPIRFISKRYAWNDYSETSIDALHPAFKNKAISFLETLSRELNKVSPNFSIQINNTLRTPEDQAKLYQNRPQYAMQVGNSPHEYGLALDFSVIDTQTKKAVTSEKHIMEIIDRVAKETGVYWGGWFVSMPKEPWHIQISRDWKATYEKLCKGGK